MGFDYVIVGAGSAGCGLAARLTEDPDRTVLLLEAGQDFPDLEATPAALATEDFNAAEHPEWLWAYNGRLTAQRTEDVPVIRGKVTGGSGAINGAGFLRNLPEDFDSWGSDLWTFDAVLPFFRTLEADRDFDGRAHGTDGPVPVGRFSNDLWAPFHEAFYASALASGHAAKPDLNDFEGLGIGPLPRNDPGGLRVNGAFAYLNPARGRPNLTLRSEAHVQRVLFDGRRATGVEVLVDGQVEVIEAGETILCGGAFESPHLLMLSGIGPAGELARLGVDVVSDLPGVGMNLSDHVAAFVLYAPLEDAEPHDGPSATAMLCATAPGSPHRGDVRLTPVSLPQVMLVSCTLDCPMSRGRLVFPSSDPSVAPEIEYSYLGDPFDLERLRHVVREAVQLVEGETWPGTAPKRLAPLDEDLASDESLDRWLGRSVQTMQHSCGTAKLGDASDKMAVVDEQCRVHGVEGLRVADLSIMPAVGRGAANPTAFMIGERVAALIKG